MFKQAFCRGTQLALIQKGLVSYSDGSDAIKVADYVADRLDFDPSQHNPEMAAKIAQHLIEASKTLQAQPGFKAASFGKVANWDDVNKIAADNAIQLMEEAEKLAEGSTIEGGDKGNMQAESPVGETKMDAAQRPPGYAENSRGTTEVDTKPGAVGSEKDQPNKPAESPSGSNSVTEQRTASLADIMRKLAEGSTILGGDKGNMEMSSAEAKMDASQRPMGYGMLSTQGALGELMNQVKGPAVIGRETPHPNAPAESPSGSNSLTQHSAKAAAEDPFVALFKKTASECVPYMPGNFSDNERIAHTRALMGMNVHEKAAYLQTLTQERTAAAPAAVPPGSRADHYQQHSPEATHGRQGAYDDRKGNQGTKAAEMPDFIRDKIEAKKEHGDDGDKDKSDNPFAKKDDGDKKDENPFAKKDDDKKDDDKEKEAAMRQHIGRISAAMAAGHR